MQSVNKNLKQNPLSLFKKTQQGFTLLEIMLVIAIMATITVFSIGIFQQQAVNAQIDKTALQMQQWLEAAKAYYVDNNQWPNGENYTGQGNGISCVNQNGTDPTALLLEGQCGPLAEDNKVYIQSGASIENNAWGQAFQLLPPALQTNQNSNMFQVSSPVPANLTNALVIAERLASRLPNATVGMLTLNAPISVIAGVTVPGSASTGGNVIIQSIQTIDCTTTSTTTSYCNAGAAPIEVAKPQCPANKVANIYLSLAGFDSTPDGQHTTTMGPVTLSPVATTDGTGWYIALNVLGASIMQHKGTVLAVLTCETPPPNKKTAGSNFTY